MSSRTVVHIVLFKFRPDVTEAHREAFAQELRTLRKLPSVLNERLIVGGPSITDPIERSKGCHYALLSFHANREALAEYQASDEHHRVTSKYLWPFKEDVTRFDFEIESEDERMAEWLMSGLIQGVQS